MATVLPTSDMTVAEVLENWPATVNVFQANKFACVGCDMAPYDTMVDVARIYGVELSTLMADLYEAIRRAEPPTGSGPLAKNVEPKESDQ